MVTKHVKADIWMKDFDMNQQVRTQRDIASRVDDYTPEKYRAMYWRLDEAARRIEHYMRNQGYFFLPAFDFPYFRGCMPLFSAYQLRVHFMKHHKEHILALNKLVVGTPYEKQPLDYVIKRSASDPNAKQIYHHAAEHYNHCFFWKMIQPYGSIIPPDLAAALAAQYGSVDEFKSQFKQAAMSFFGSGWLWLVYRHTTKKFEIQSLENDGCPLVTPGDTPMIAMDLWEHTWYLDWENDKSQYVERFFSVIDWHWAEKEWKVSRGVEYYPIVYH